MATQQGNWSRQDRDAWQRQRLREELARGVHSKSGSVARHLQGKPPLKSPPNKAFDKINDQLSRQIKRAIDDAIRSKMPQHSRADAVAAAERGARIDFAGSSTCFDELYFENGTAFAVFQSGHEYSAPIDLDTFLDWTADSAGKFFNGVLGRDFFVSH